MDVLQLNRVEWCRVLRHSYQLHPVAGWPFQMVNWLHVRPYVEQFHVVAKDDDCYFLGIEQTHQPARRISTAQWLKHGDRWTHKNIKIVEFLLLEHSKTGNDYAPRGVWLGPLGSQLWDVHGCSSSTGPVARNPSNISMCSVWRWLLVFIKVILSWYMQVLCVSTPIPFLAVCLPCSVSVPNLHSDTWKKINYVCMRIRTYMSDTYWYMFMKGREREGHKKYIYIYTLYI